MNALMLGNSLVSSSAALIGGGGGGNPELGFLAFVGSSSAYYSSIYDIGANSRQFYGDGYANHALWRLGGGVTLLRNFDNDDAFHFGAPGATMQQLLAATTGLYDLAIAAAQEAYAATGKCTLIVTQPGLNNIGSDDSAATVYGYCEDVMDRVEAAGPGVKLLFTEAWPRLASETNAASRLAVRLALNGLLQAGVPSRGHGLIACEDVGDDGSGYLLTTWSDAIAPGHGTVPFASRVGNLVYDWVASNCVVPTFDLWNYSASMVTGKNVELTGTGGTGGRPTGWSYGNGSGTTQVTWSLVPYGDGSGRNWFRTSLTNTGTASGNMQWASTITTGFNIGDTVEAMCELRFTDPTSFALGSVALSVFGAGSNINPICNAARLAQQSPPIGIEYHTDKLVLRTPLTVIASGTTSLNLRIDYTGNATSFDIGTPCMFINGATAGLPQYYP